MDKLKKSQRAESIARVREVLEIDEDQLVAFSSHTGEGRDELLGALAELLGRPRMRPADGRRRRTRFGALLLGAAACAACAAGPSEDTPSPCPRAWTTGWSRPGSARCSRTTSRSSCAPTRCSSR
jgi:hypothetical protein